jgi:hypothetical protein
VNDAEWRQCRRAVAERLDGLIPGGADEFTRDVLLQAMDRRREALALPSWDSARAVGELLCAAYELGTHQVPDPPAVSPNPRTNPELARALFNACQALIVGTPADGPLPPNKFHATRHDSALFYVHGQTHHLTPEEAVNLAVWLIALADPTLADAVPMLLRVATR